jgi:hypothetical protein
MGRFTAALVSGIESGAADGNRTGKVFLSDLRRYLERVVTGQAPKFFARNASGDPLISLNPLTPSPVLDSGVLANQDAQQGPKRRAAVSNRLLGALLALTLIALAYAVYDDVQRHTPSTPIISASNKPTFAGLPASPRAPASPVEGTWDVFMSCPAGSALREPGAQFRGGLFARAFQNPSGQTQLAMTHISADALGVTGFVYFNDAGTYEVNGFATLDGVSSFSGTGRFGSSTDCKLTIKSTD